MPPPPDRTEMDEADADAFRQYMHAIDRLFAEALGEDPDAICPTCGSTAHRDHAFGQALSGAKAARLARIEAGDETELMDCE